jgi:uncharacterized protein
MHLRGFGKTGWQVSALGFGCMRLPTRGGSPMGADIREDEAIRMIRHAIDRGVNYVDTAYPYHGGNSERVLGKALQNGYRERVKLATKSPVWMIQSPADFDRFLDEQLEKLQAHCIDCYLLHGLGRDRWENVVLKHGLLKRAEAARDDGRIRHIGFSFHDRADAFKLIADGYDGWEFCQVQYNYVDVQNQAGTAGVKYAASKGLAVIVMEPLLGGKLARLPEDVGRVFDATGVRRPWPEWALQWLWDQSEISLVLSGMTTFEQVEANLAAAERSGIGLLRNEELRAFEQVRGRLTGLQTIPCTRCGYCLPCPSGVDIPRNLELYNDSHIYNDPTGCRMSYRVYGRFFGSQVLAGACIQCGVCEEKCPQSIPIREWMPKIHALLGEGMDR